VVRVVNASLRRAQLQAKIGIGMTPHVFSEAIQRGEIGHAGLSSSLRLLAKGLGINLEKTSEAFTPLIADRPTSSSVLGPVKAGSVRGIYQIARGYRARREVITLELTMALDEPDPRDTIDIVGEPPLHFEGELPGDSCTVATVLSAISVIVTMPAGLRTVLDVPLEQPEEPQSSKDTPPLKRRGRDVTQLPTKGRERIIDAPRVAPIEAPSESSKRASAKAKRPESGAKKSPHATKAAARSKKPKKSPRRRAARTTSKSVQKKTARAAKRAPAKPAPRASELRRSASRPVVAESGVAVAPSRGRASKDAQPTIVAGGARAHAGAKANGKSGAAANGDLRKKSQA
jgi:hypothetical protein